MKQVNLYEAKTNLSALVEEAAGGVEIVIAKNGKAKAKLVAVTEPAGRKRRAVKYGMWADCGWKVPEDFDDPDPELEALIYGDDEGETGP